MKCVFLNLLALLILAGAARCQTPKKAEIATVFSAPPFDMGGLAMQFARDIEYGAHPLQRFDLFLPKGKKGPLPLVVFIHGGGFTGGDKGEIYKNPKRVEDIKALLAAGIAYANLNYRLLRPGDQEGVRKCLNDSRYGLQFIRHHAAQWGLDKENIAGYGFSAGASTALWLGAHDDMKEPGHGDPVRRESTRLKAVVARETQASLDLERWATDVFADFPTMHLAEIVRIAGGPKVFGFYGLDDPLQFNSPPVRAYRADIDIPALMDAKDAPLWLENDNPADLPAKRGELFHHPFHAKTVQLRADAVGLSSVARIPGVPGMTTATQTHLQFLISKFQ